MISVSPASIFQDGAHAAPFLLTGGPQRGGQRDKNLYWPAGCGNRNPAPRTALAGLAQLVERVICNHDVGGSNPSAGTSFFTLRHREMAAPVILV